MMYNNLVLALRNVLKNKTFALMNIGGLAVSLASCVFIFFYVYDELSYDRFHENARRIYRVTQTFITPENTQNLRFTHQKLGPYLQRIYPQVESYVRFEGEGVKIGKQKIRENAVFKADPSVFRVFTYPLVEGDPETALAKPNSIVLSETLAKKYFDGPALGQSIEVDGGMYDVTGVMRDVPANSDKWVAGLMSSDFGGEGDAFFAFTYDTYILLRSEQDEVFIREALATVARDLHTEVGQDVRMGYDMQKLSDLHFYQGVGMDNPKGNITHIYLFTFVASILLVVAIINFVNLTTVRSLDRAKEVGVRKVTGANRAELVRQFVAESFLSVFLAALLSLSVVQFFRTLFGAVSGKYVSLSNDHDALVISVIIVLLVAIVVLSSFYPAWILSSYQPAAVLKGKLKNGRNGNTLQKIFTVGQFALSSGLLLFLIAVVAQMKYMNDADLGFSGDKIVVVKAPEDSLVQSNSAYYRNELLKTGLVEEVSIGGFASNLGTTEPFASPLWIMEPAGKRQLIVPNITVDKNYPGMLQLQVKTGKSFSDLNVDGVEGKVLVNESFVKLAGWTNPVGQKVCTYAGEGTVIGVVKNFHFQSLHNTIEPLVIMGQSDKAPDVRYFFFKVSSADLNGLKTAWRALFPDVTMEYFFLNDFFNRQYQSDEDLMSLFLYFSLMTIGITACGLLGLILYHVETKMKEVGIRKVFGAGVPSLVRWLTVDLVTVVLAGTSLGVVGGSWFAIDWLNGFAYRVDLDVWMITLTIGSVLTLATLIVGYKAWQGATSNVVDVIKYE